MEEKQIRFSSSVGNDMLELVEKHSVYGEGNQQVAILCGTEIDHEIQMNQFITIDNQDENLYSKINQVATNVEYAVLLVTCLGDEDEKKTIEFYQKFSNITNKNLMLGTIDFESFHLYQLNKENQLLPVLNYTIDQEEIAKVA